MGDVTNNTQVVIPFHQCKAWFEVIGVTIQTPSSYIGFYHSADRAGYIGMPLITITNSELVINGPGRLKLQASAEKPTLPDQSMKYDVQVTVHLLPTNVDRPVVLSVTVPYPIICK